MKYFLTGATGFVGGCLARQLVEAGHQVSAVVRSPDRAGDLAALGVALYPGDITDRESLRAPMTGADGLFHVAGWYRIGTRDKAEGRRVNVEGTRHVLEMMRALDIPRGVYTSSLAVYGDTRGRLVDESHRSDRRHASVYDRTKWEAHYGVAEPMMRAGLPLVIVQPGLVYGPGDPGPMGDAFRLYLRGRLPVLPQRSAYCWGHIEDMARAHLLAMEKGRPGESYNTCGPAHTLIEAMALAETVTGIPAPRLHLAPGALRAMAAAAALVDWALPLPGAFTAEGLRVSAGITYLGDSSKARRELSFEARSLAAGLPDFLHHELRRL